MLSSPPRPGLSLPLEPGQLPPLPPPPESEPPAVVQPPFRSPLKLTPEQFTKLERTTIDRLQEIRNEMGLSIAGQVQPQSWMWLRKCHEAYYQGDLSWRLAMGGIFQKSNFTLGSGLRHVRYLSARVQDDMLGTSPFMAALGQNHDKEELAKQVETKVQQEIENSTIRGNLREAQKVAIYRNECTVKIGYLDDSTPYIGEATVLVDDVTGEPVLTPELGMLIYEDDNFFESPTTEGMAILEKDPSFSYAKHPDEGVVTLLPTEELPQRTGHYEYFNELPQTLQGRKGVYCEPLDYRAFLCPLKIRSIHDADTCAHLYLQTPSRIKKQYGGIDVSQQYFSWWNAPGDSKPKFEQGEKSNPDTSIYQQLIVGEVYARCDPDETGEDKEVFLVFDLSNEKLIYFNYLSNHMKKRPFEVIPGVEKVPGRWYGRGIYGMLEDHLLYEDAELNRANFKNSINSTFTYAYKSAFANWRAGQPPVIGSEEVNWVDENWAGTEKGIDPIRRVNLNADINPDLEMMNTMRQSADSLVGAISTQSASQSDFNQSKTATGNQLVQQASDVITKATEQDQADALNAILDQVVGVILEHLPRKSLVLDPKTNQLATLNRDEIRSSLKTDVRLLLTRSKSSQLLNTSQQLIDLGLKFWQLLTTMPRAAKALRSSFVSQAKALESNDTDEMFPEVTDEMIQAAEQPQQAAEQPKPVSKSISTKYSDLERSEQEQVLAAEGIQPAKPEEVAQRQAQEAAQSAAEAAASRPPPNIP